MQQLASAYYTYAVKNSVNKDVKHAKNYQKNACSLPRIRSYDALRVTDLDQIVKPGYSLGG